MIVQDYSFNHIADLTPIRTVDGAVQTYLPQDRYLNERGVALNRYGTGPFCKFAIPWTLNKAGVYLIVVSGEIRYVGECENLSSRFNMGYGNISPRNCFKGGQETNCRLNALIYEVSSRGESVELWFLETSEYKRVETELRSYVRAEWNRA